MSQQDIGRFIAEKRKQKNLTQEQFAERIGVSNKTVSKWENGKCMPDYSVIELLCKELDITVTELLDGKASDHTETPNDEKYEKLLYKLQQTENKIHVIEHKTQTGIKTGVSFGCALAMVISYVNWQSIGWAILHGIMSWGYVIYYLIKY
jgi:transcriptional regulator with XRE-family HTH domain